MIGSLIGGALKIGGTIAGGISASKAMKRVKKNLEAQRAANQNWFDRRSNEDATARADARRVLSMTQERLRQRDRQLAGHQAVMGGSDAALAVEQAAGTEALAEAASQIAVNGERRKDQIEQEYMNRDAQLQGQLNDMERGRAKEIKSAGERIANVGGSIFNEASEQYLDKFMK